MKKFPSWAYLLRSSSPTAIFSKVKKTRPRRTGTVNGAYACAARSRAAGVFAGSETLNGAVSLQLYSNTLDEKPCIGLTLEQPACSASLNLLFNINKDAFMSASYRETTYEFLRNRGISRRDFLKFCSLTAVSLGLGPMGHVEIAEALQNKSRLAVIWINGLSCSCCTESFIRTSHPLATDIILNMIAMDYQDLIMASSGEQATASFEESVNENWGNYLLAVEGNAPLGNNGMFCIDGGKPFLEKLRYAAKGCKAVIAWGSCASWGCVQAAHPNPTQATPVHKLIHDRPVINVPGCPALPEVMSAIVAYLVTYDRLPHLDAQGRPLAFYGKRVHDQCVRRAHFDAGQFVESWDDEGASLGLCLYKMGCKGPTTYNACPSTRWNDGVSYPIQSGHGCIGCSENGFWDRGSFYDRVTTIPQLGTHATADNVGLAIVGAIAAGVGLHAAISTGVHLKRRSEQEMRAAKNHKQTPLSENPVQESSPPDPTSPRE